MTLDELPRDEPAIVTSLDSTGAERRRLMDLGLLPGIEVRAERTSPLGDPTAYLVRGSVIALRRSQARGIHIEPAAQRAR
jgi:ferrous iron transport protein A